VHYPFENKDEFDTVLKQADYICEGVDQTRRWFYSLHAHLDAIIRPAVLQKLHCLELVSC